MGIKRILLTSSLLVAFGFAYAQEIRLSGGFNVVNPGNTGSDVRYDGGTGFQFMADAQFGDRVYLQPGIGYMIRSLDYTTIDPTAVELFSTGYQDQNLRLSVLGGYRFLDEYDRSAFNIRGYFGPSLLIGMASRFDRPLALVPETNAAQLYLTVGTGLDYNIFFVDAGYDLALSNAFSEQFARGRMNLLHVNFGIRLRFMGRTATTAPVIDG